MNKRQTRIFAIAATAISALVFLGLTLDSHRQFGKLTNADAITPTVTLGKDVWHKNNCINCHTLFGEGAYYAPDLTKITQLRGEAYLTAYMKDPSKFYDEKRHRRLMPKQDLSDEDIKGLIVPVQPEGYLHNWYNYTSRVDMKAIGWTGAPAPMRDAIMAAIQAEGAPVGIWQRFILPDMTVFKAKNAYGGGCPWSCPFADKLGEKVNYRREDFPVAQRHCDTHFGMTVPLRAPNTTASAALVGEAFLKVFENLNELKVKA